MRFKLRACGVTRCDALPSTRDATWLSVTSATPADTHSAMAPLESNASTDLVWFLVRGYNSYVRLARPSRPV